MGERETTNVLVQMHVEVRWGGETVPVAVRQSSNRDPITALNFFCLRSRRIGVERINPSFSILLQLTTPVRIVHILHSWSVAAYNSGSDRRRNSYLLDESHENSNPCSRNSFEHGWTVLPLTGTGDRSTRERCKSVH